MAAIYVPRDVLLFSDGYQTIADNGPKMGFQKSDWLCRTVAATPKTKFANKAVNGLKNGFQVSKADLPDKLLGSDSVAREIESCQARKGQGEGYAGKTGEQKELDATVSQQMHTSK